MKKQTNGQHTCPPEGNAKVWHSAIVGLSKFPGSGERNFTLSAFKAPVRWKYFGSFKEQSLNKLERVGNCPPFGFPGNPGGGGVGKTREK